MPPAFSWVDPPHLAALAHPDGADDLAWLRRNGVDVLITLSEHPVPKGWVNDAGLMAVHIPIEDMTAPTLAQLEQAVDTVERARRSGMGVAVHCLAGQGRTGTVLAAYFVARGLSAAEAILKVRSLRPRSIETGDQERAVAAWERWKRG